MNAVSPSRWRARLTIILAIGILVPSLAGFATKFVEFIRFLGGTPDGAFTIAPVVNYLLATFGLLLLLVWATLNGMFRDVERPKYELLRREAELDREA